MNKLPGNVTRVIGAVVVLAVVAGAGWFFFLAGSSSKKVSANFSSGVGVYPGTPVKILGIEVGAVTKVTPSGNSVKIDMKYDSKYKVPADAISVVVANSLVSDRYIQLAPAYPGKGPTLKDGANIPLARTASPAELDDIYGALNELSVALGPNGANKNGSLSTLVKVAAANLKGNGAAFGNSITQLSKAAATLSNGRDDLFGTVRNLEVFTRALSASDVQVRHFEEQLAQVAGDLADERADLGAALHNLTGALHDVAIFVKTNAGKVHTDIVGLKDITGILVKQQAALNETLTVGPVALSNIVHAYQETQGTLGTRSNLSNLLDPASLCEALNSVALQTLPGGLGDLLGGASKLLGPLTKQIATNCTAILKQANAKAPPKVPNLNDLRVILGGQPIIPGAGG
ncbi:MAG: phospholipid/cholesterol/gamma-HCH transport system substrate-binding protein [Pseudonocardiales bacterium]|jgi:phospholipid/cholesterol/gamma-HCH transport system substrate-binding protein|nr:phospholipid/cholesterol/gamma-HCH transport system substrate-binding protein [Pseudonocardiales bacterium]